MITPSGESTDSSFIDAFGFAVADFFDDDWDDTALEGAVDEAVDFICYAYGKFDNPEDVDSGKEDGFLSELGDIGLSDLANNPDAYNWILRYLEDIADFLSWVDFFPDGIADEVQSLAGDAREVTRFVPLVASVRALLDTGCGLHDQIDAGNSPSEKDYVELFQNVALVVAEVVLLTAGIGASYRVAYGATGWVNRQLINVVGRSIGWRAYSWVLSQIHWGIRVAFTEGFDQSIVTTVDIVSEGVIDASSGTNSAVSDSQADTWAQAHVESMAAHTDGWDIDYERWEANQRVNHLDSWIDQMIASLMERWPF
ncbi:hypothetical protein NDI56_20875 [Haloarcula sp. S1CR25-12]|uniref:Uncharacterized protein n=1 Tax=Haloarcula saliterrae TaxID=2950534 RepID=A0ABU2FHX5_9EURY|nr:hypothetical protein [Haloarcula sp. S1CR25-12]MDS0261862.1 hypothetical protein [Haloarcula sp. S1CR25-12]